ncbi:MAG: VOC family protein [Candidatus Bipolaricaulis sp.]|nr:VOC family protein [Candidatus Bipolaricaulis sp.]
MSQGDVGHLEYPTTDLRASKASCSTVFGWSFRDIPGMEDYALFSTPGGQQGGFSGRRRAEDPTDKGPIAHVEVADIDAALVTINQLGGRTLTPKTRISDQFDFYALFLDNAGNRLGLWSPA